MRTTSSRLSALAAALAAAVACPACDGGNGTTTAADMTAADAGTCLAPGARPSQRDAHGAIYVPATKKIVVFGGDSAPFDPSGMTASVYLDETWTYDTTCGLWSLQSPPTHPVRRGAFAADLDAKRGRVLVVGGREHEGSYHLLGDVWAFDVAKGAWRQLQPAGAPPAARQSHRVVYDAGRDRLLLFGGNTASIFAGHVVGDTWELSFSGSDEGTWRQLPGSGPKARQDMGAALDTKRGLWVLFGGSDNFQPTGYSNETWLFDLATSTWRKLATSGQTPSRRFWADLVYDAARDRVVLFGGHDDGAIGLENDTYALQLAGDGQSGEWKRLVEGDAALSQEGVNLASPERRSKHTLVAYGDTAWLFGGITDCGPIDDVWTLHLTNDNWAAPYKAKVGETCYRRAGIGQTCDSDCGAPH